MFWSKSRILTTSPNSHRGPEAAGWISRCNVLWNTTGGKKQKALFPVYFLFSKSSTLNHNFISTMTAKQIQKHFTPFLVHTRFHPLVVLFLFYKSTGCQDGCTTAACKGRRFETEWGNSNFELELFSSDTEMSKHSHWFSVIIPQEENPPLLSLNLGSVCLIFFF